MILLAVRVQLADRPRHAALHALGQPRVALATACVPYVLCVCWILQRALDVEPRLVGRREPAVGRVAVALCHALELGEVSYRRAGRRRPVGRGVEREEGAGHAALRSVELRAVGRVDGGIGSPDEGGHARTLDQLPILWADVPHALRVCLARRRRPGAVWMHEDEAEQHGGAARHPAPPPPNVPTRVECGVKGLID